MTAETPTLSIAELEKLLDSKKNSLVVMTQRRQDLADQIAELDQQIQQMADLRSSFGRLPRKRPVNASSLRSVVLGLLNKNRKGFKLADLAAKIKETGYRSHSNNFTNVVYQSIYNSPEIELDSKSGCYRLKK